MKPHGHVTPNPDGLKARCGGPALCSICASELAAKREQDLARADAAAVLDDDIGDDPIVSLAAALNALDSAGIVFDLDHGCVVLGESGYILRGPGGTWVLRERVATRF